LNEEQYRSLCETCDRILLDPDSTDERVAIPCLHVIREHPVFLGNYTEAFNYARSIKETGRKWLRFLRRRVWWLLQLGRAARSKGKLWFAPKELSAKIDVLFVSHLINVSHAGCEEDFYFGEMPSELAAHGYSVAITLVNFSRKPGSYIANKCKLSLVPRIILSDSLGIHDDATIRSRLKKESLRLSLLAKKESPGFAQRILEQASEESLSGGAHLNLQIANQIGALVEKLQPKVIVIIHEGHAWERLAFSAARSAHSNVLCIGYQHAAVFRLQHSIRRSLAPKYNPDKILTAGDISCTQLRSSLGLEGIPISVLGSNRRFKGRTTAPEPQTHKHSGDNSAGGPVCLVLPEGVASECNLILEFSILCAMVNPDIQYIWRLHPAVSFASLQAKNPKLRSYPKNVFLSQATLEEDISRSCWALYRGTTAIVQAVMAGLRPIYLHSPGELTIDPLYELDIWRVSVASVSEFHLAILPNIETSTVQLASDIEQARKYCERFFTPLDTDKLAALIR
jgi:hypothetical protein